MKEFSASKVKIIIIIRESIIQFCKSFTSLTLLLNFDREMTYNIERSKILLYMGNTSDWSLISNLARQKIQDEKLYICTLPIGSAYQLDRVLTTRNCLRIV